MKPEYNEVVADFDDDAHAFTYAIFIRKSQMESFNFNLSIRNLASYGNRDDVILNKAITIVRKIYDLSWNDRTRLIFPEKPWFEKTDDDWMDELSFGERFEAILRHVNKDLNLPDEQMFLTCQEDGYTDDDGDEISFNWNIIKWRQV